MKLFGHKKQKEEENPIVVALRALGEKDWAVRHQAREEIAKCGTAIIPVLTQVIEDRSVETQWATAQKSLDGLDYYTQEAVQELINDCKSGIVAVEKEANKRLKKLPRKTREAIIQMAELKNAMDKCQRRQRECVYLLGEIGTAANCLDEIAPILVKVLSYPAALPYVKDVNEAAEETLVRIGAPAIPALLSSGAKANSKVSRILAKVGPKSIDEIVQALEHKNGEVRSLAAEVLGQMGGRAKIAVPGLVKALRAPNKEARASAARAIARIGARQEDVPSLIAALADENKEIVRNVAKALGQLGLAAREAVPALMLGEAKAPKEVREALVKIGSEDASAIARELCDERKNIRSLAAEVLPELGSKAKAAIPDLVRSLSDPEKEVRAGAARAIARIGVRSEDIPSLIAALADENKEVARNVANALGQLGSAAKEAVPALILGEAKVHKEVRQALVNIAYEDTSTIVRELCHERKEVRRLAAEVLGGIGSKAKVALTDLVRALSDPEREVRAGAAKAIATIEVRKEDLPSLIAALADADEMTVRNVVEALGTCGGAAREAVPFLTELLKDEKYQNAVIDAIEKIGDARAVGPLLEYAFAAPRDSYLTSEVEEALLKVVPNSTLTKEMATCAMRASSYDHLYHEGWKYDAGYISLKASDKAIKKLCDTKSPITSNILHLVAKKRDISVTMDKGCAIGSPWEEEVSFAKQKETARGELARRGSPPYDPSAFTKSTG